MSSPAIVLMTDPARCSQSDVHHLVQALLEIRQMGEHAMPQAFCDHPESAREFIDAYAHAYPQLVLEDREIPTPAHLQSLISTGQVGAFGQPAELASEDLLPPAEPNGANGVPIVVLTMGSSQVLFDALQQAPAIRESIRLIDVAPEREDVLSVAVAEAVAGRGIDGGSPDHQRAPMELDDVPGVAKADLTGVALQDDQMSLDVVETVEAARTEPAGYAQGAPDQPAWVAPPAAVAPAPSVVAERTGAAAPDASPAGVTGMESASELASPPVAPPVIPPVDQPLTAMPTTADVVAPVAVEQVEPGEQTIEPEAQSPGDGDAGGKVDGPAGEKKSAAGNEHDGDDADDVGGKAGKSTADQDDVEYPPVGSLAAGADVLYPAHDRDDPRGVLRELANVLLDEAMFDPALSAELAEAQRGEGVPVPARQEQPLDVPQGDHVVVLEDHYGAGEQDSEDQLADGIARPLHDSDL